MNAIEARAKAIQILEKSDKHAETLNMVYDAINYAVEEHGAFKLNITVPYPHHDYVLMKLQEDGYKVEIVFESFRIAW